jgi:3-isopropylmalate dehydrogenase
MTKTYRLAVLPGDGIGPEVIAQGLRVLQAVGNSLGIAFEQTQGLIGGCAVDQTGTPLPPQTLALAQQSDAVLLGAVGGPQYDALPAEQRPEKGLLGIRKALGLYANLRPVCAYPALLNTSALKPEVLSGVDLMVVRELTGGLYFGEPRYRDADKAVDTLVYTRQEIERIAHQAFALARLRRAHLTSVDKANVLASSQLWREVVTQIAQQYPDVTLSHMLVDNAAMQLIRAPKAFDVLLTENMFGDILSDEASMLTGSLGMLPSASLGTSGISLYEPSHGSAPDIAGQDKANPIATILSVAMMLELSFDQPQAAQWIRQAVSQVLDQGLRTADIAENQTSLGTKAMGDAILSALPALAPVF